MRARIHVQEYKSIIQQGQAHWYILSRKICYTTEGYLFSPRFNLLNGEWRSCQIKNAKNFYSYKIQYSAVLADVVLSSEVQERDLIIKVLSTLLN